MIRRSMLLRFAVVLLASVGVSSSAGAAIGPVPVVKATWGDTYLPPGGRGVFELQMRNVGDAALQPGFAIEDELPAGVRAKKVIWQKYGFSPYEIPCAILDEGSKISCTLDDLDALYRPLDEVYGLGWAPGPLSGSGFFPQPSGYPLSLWIEVEIERGASSPAVNTATVTNPIAVATGKDGGPRSNEAQEITVKASAGQYRLTATTAGGTGTSVTGSKEITSVSTTLGAFHVGDAITSPGIASAFGTGEITAGSKVVASVFAFPHGSAFAVGQAVAGLGIPAGTTITALKSVPAPPGYAGGFYDLTLSAPATGNGLSDLVAETTVTAVGPGTLTLSANATLSGALPITAQETTAAIDWDAPAVGTDSVQSALGALPGIGAGNVTVEGGPGDATGSSPYTVSFTGALAGTDLAQLEPRGAATALSGGAPDFTDTDQVPFSPTPAPFGVVPGGFVADVFSAAFPFGEPSRQAGDHPFEQRVDFDLTRHLNETENQFTPGATPSALVRTVDVTLPRGMIGNPEAVPKCDPLDFANQGASQNGTHCPSDTQVGYLNVMLQPGVSGTGGKNQLLSRVPIYNLRPPRGKLVDLAFQAGGYVQGHIYAELDPARNYAVKAVSPEISALVPVLGAEATIWGVPGDPAHDSFRFYPDPLTAQELSERKPIAGAPFRGAIRPFFTNPMDCGFDNGGSRIQVESYTEPGVLTPSIEYGQPDNVTGCDDLRFRFEPDISLEPTDRHAGAPTGLEVKLKVPQRNDEAKSAEELYARNGFVKGIATPPIKKTVVTLPEGMTLNPSAGQGLDGCSLSQLGMSAAGVPDGEPVHCPPASQIGTLIMHSPDLPENEPLTGRVYIARQSENPFGSLFALYLVLENADRGLLVKLAGRIDLDEHTGQIRTEFDNIPQFPVSDFQLIFKGGIRAALVNPVTCGPKTITAEYFSWQDPGTPHIARDAYEVTQRPDGGACLNSLAERPFSPQLSAGTVNPTGGAFSPFTLQLTRSDEDQEISTLGVTLPPGLLGKIAGVPQCPESAIAQAKGREGVPGDGALEFADPSCPASSQVGTTLVGVGTGASLTWVPGQAYFAGPYKGAPFSLVVLTPSVVGPYDLGVVALRNALYIDPLTAQVNVVSDPLPQILDGIPVRIRDVRVSIDRSQFTFNPTSCAEQQISSAIGSIDGASAHPADRFQAASCASLAFKPKFTVSTSGKTSRSNGASLDVKLSYPKAPWGTQANIAKVKVNLPKQLPSRLSTLQKGCLDTVFDADPAACPAASRVGMATASTPVLPVPLSGPAYFVSHGGAKFPELIIVLQGDGVTVQLHGETFISKKGITSSTFRSVPDVPVSTFELKLPQGPYSALGANGNLCNVRGGLKMPTIFTAQNGIVLRQTTRVKVNGCAKHHAKRRKRAKRKR